MKLMIWMLVCLIVCCACDSKKKTKVIQEGGEPAVIIDRVWDDRVDMKHLDTLVFHLTEDKQKIVGHFGATRLIPLETKSESLIGEVEKIICHNGKIYILNRAGNNSSIMVFDHHGTYQAKIEKNGRGPGEYVRLGDFDMDDNGNIYILDGMRVDRLLVYNNDLQYERTIMLESSTLSFGIFNGNIWIYTARRDYKNKHKYLILGMDKNGKVNHKFFPFEHVMRGTIYSGNDIFMKSGGKLYINMPYTDVIYSLDSLNKVRGEYCLQYEMKKSMGEYVNRFEDDVFKSFFPLNNGIIVQTTSMRTETASSSFLFGYYNKSTNTSDFVDMWGVKNDFPKDILISPWANTVRCILNDTAMIHPMQAVTFLNVYKRNPDKYKNVSEKQKEIIDKVNEEDNPILFINPIL